MNTFDEIQRKKGEILAVARKHGIINMRVFGSVVRGEDNPQSDIDLLVELEDGRTLFDMGGAVVKLEELLGRKIDIVTERGLHWYLREKIMKDDKLYLIP